jgi:zinc protease
MVGMPEMRTPRVRPAIAWLGLAFLLLAQASAQQGAGERFFPYQMHTRSLDNGLRVIVVPAPEFKDMVTFLTPVFAGGRNETQQGKTGLAHLFEHVMFRHEFGGQPGGYDEHIRRMGAHNNATTSYDMTWYYPTTFTANLTGPLDRPAGPTAGLIELEASRFIDLKLDEKTFQTEAGAVLGEYRRGHAVPELRLLESMSAAAFPDHPYGHLVIGFAKDVENMPQASEAAWAFFRNYYAPNNAAIIVVGDVRPDAIFAEVERRYSRWQRQEIPRIPPRKEPARELTTHVAWDADVSPRIMVSYHTPPMQPGTAETAVTMLLSELLTSQSAPLYQKLRYEKQTVTAFSDLGIHESADPFVLALVAELSLDRFKKEGAAYVNDVRGDVVAGVEALKSFSKTPGAAQTLEMVKSKYRNDFLASLNSTLRIASTLAQYYKFNRDPAVIDTLMQAIGGLSPADVDAYAGRYFTPERRVISTLWAGAQKPGAQ